MNSASQPRPAVLHYDTPEYDIIAPGDFVLCAISGKPIPLEMLTYWSVEAQEAYAGAAEAVQAWLQRHPPKSARND
ncbi:DUF2093 domain-containing protein [Sphingomonas cavernae]|uniref:DUF2093 domain-containing protein n=1 Tax=Sphingomonas cavernae TaxID=2320861 RepID=A0A418WN20_9SPHN|nr:DUF2093 domain-containing protein [Sphingomonas cavernae]RJF91387.1 DUF2093 domain-containing protein [Sphingomonas cavernae]